MGKTQKSTISENKDFLGLHIRQEQIYIFIQTGSLLNFVLYTTG